MKAKHEGTKMFVNKTGDKVIVELEITKDPDEAMSLLMKSLSKNTELVEGVKVSQILFNGTSIENLVDRKIAEGITSFQEATNNIIESIKENLKVK